MPKPKKSQITQQVAPCAACSAKNYDRGRFHALYGLCAYCFSETDTRQQAGDTWRMRQPERPRPWSKPTRHQPGTSGKIAELAARLARGEHLHNPDDARPWDLEQDPDAEQAQPVDDPQPADIALCPGVEADRSRRTVVYRARPCHRGIRVTIGQYPAYSEAVEQVRRFWRDIQRKKWYRAEACAIVLCWDGWHVIDTPEGIPQAVARTAGRKIMAAEWLSLTAARDALDRLILDRSNAVSAVRTRAERFPQLGGSVKRRRPSTHFRYPEPWIDSTGNEKGYHPGERKKWTEII